MLCKGEGHMDVMDVTLSDEQRMLRDMVERLTVEQYGFDVRQAAIRDHCGFHRPFWKELGQLGVLGATLPEDCGGSGADHMTAMLIMSAFGKNLVIAPYLSTVISAAALLARVGTTTQQAQYLPRVIEGDSIIAFACEEGNDVAEVGQVKALASPAVGGFNITGQKTGVVGGIWSDFVMVVAKIEGTGGTIGAFLLPVDTPGVEMNHARTIDGGSTSTVHLQKAFVPSNAWIGEYHDNGEAVERICDEATAMMCADAVGSMETLLGKTVEYARTRIQFGAPIGKFQALQHRMVDMLVGCEQSSSITHHAVVQLNADPVERKRAVSAAKALVGRVGRMVAQSAVQIHGGIGTTDELDVSHHFRRIETFNFRFGTTDRHIRRYADLLDSREP
ncbi:pimeloyl-CoA dehydrogenase small subunit [Paraburkholderia sp. 5N]|uniref:Pimeloyl-CoA dehydrogenase small subunit n=2 Tax=Paraburkholderia elongata TaxID=2675747 RepID=A0A972SPS0_9BURK|nr:pimeloyl-CoA dehydrogenase small subunit [Paraburkholderia elongata]